MKQPMFSQRHYEAIAKVLKENKWGGNPMRLTITEEIQTRLSDLFEDDNPAFKRTVFHAACEPKDGNVQTDNLNAFRPDATEEERRRIKKA